MHHSGVAILKNGVIRALSDHPSGTTPSVVGVGDRGSLVTGLKAIPLLNKGRAIAGSKRLLGVSERLLNGELDPLVQRTMQEVSLHGMTAAFETWPGSAHRQLVITCEMPERLVLSVATGCCCCHTHSHLFSAVSALLQSTRRPRRSGSCRSSSPRPSSRPCRLC